MSYVGADPTMLQELAKANRLRRASQWQAREANRQLDATRAQIAAIRRILDGLPSTAGEQEQRAALDGIAEQVLL